MGLNAAMGMALPLVVGAIYAVFLDGTRWGVVVASVLIGLAAPMHNKIESKAGPPPDRMAHGLRLTAMLVGAAVGLFFFFLFIFPQE